MASHKRQPQNSGYVYIRAKTKSAEQNCQSTAITTAVFSFAKSYFGNQDQQLHL